VRISQTLSQSFDACLCHCRYNRKVTRSPSHHLSTHPVVRGYSTCVVLYPIDRMVFDIPPFTQLAGPCSKRYSRGRVWACYSAYLLYGFRPALFRPFESRPEGLRIYLESLLFLTSGAVIVLFFLVAGFALMGMAIFGGDFPPSRGPRFQLPKETPRHGVSLSVACLLGC
jgi:hypothetical protein